MDRDLNEVVRLRTESPEYAALRQQLRALFGRKRVIVIGSARGFVPPASRPGDVHVCINASAVNAESMGVIEPEVSLLLGFMTLRKTRHSRASYDALYNRGTGHLFLLTTVIPLDECIANLLPSGFRAGSIGEIDSFAKAALVGEVFGEEFGFGKLDEKVSNGVLAVACALLGEAAEVVLAGFSLVGGHSYTSFTTRRLHVAPDRRFLTLCAGHCIPVSTTSIDLARATGLALAPLGNAAQTVYVLRNGFTPQSTEASSLRVSK